jgi:ribosomal protein S18 acetylase RimI-like enzyme
MGEFLSFGVLEDYRKVIDQMDKISIPNVLMKLVSSHFKKNNIRYILLRILKTNVRAIKFYHKHSGYVIPSDNLNEVVMIIQT